MRRPRRTVRVGLLGVAVAGLLGCGNDGPVAFVPAEVTGDPMVLRLPEPQPEQRVNALDNQFVLDELTVAPGTPVRWVNGGEQDHNIIAIDTLSGFGVKEENFVPGQEYEYTFLAPGRYRYYCSLHGSETAGMVGEVVVADK